MNVLACEHGKPACWGCLGATEGARQIADLRQIAADPDVRFATNSNEYGAVLHSISCRCVLHPDVLEAESLSRAPRLLTRHEALEWLAVRGRRRCGVCCPDIDEPAPEPKRAADPTLKP